MVGQLIALLAATAVAVTAAPPAEAARPLRTGFLDEIYKQPDGVSAPWVERTREVDATLIRVNVSWRTVTGTRVPAAERDPADAAYDWAELDAAVRRLRAAGLDVLLTVYDAPRWAEGPRRPRSAPAGTWRPDPARLGRFAHALATRYSGTFADLPRVRAFMLWNEPNLTTYLSPQFVRSRGRTRGAAPAHYRRMLRTFQPAVKGVHQDNLVVAGGTSPYGDEPGGSRTRPVRFVREWLCARRGRCGRQRFDVLSHHPYSVGKPRRRALSRDDVSIPDLGKLTRLLRSARRRGTVAGSPKVWVTEVSYDSSPPDPDGVPEARHARWLAETMYLSWRAGASALIWLQIRDSPPDPSYSASYQSGVFFRDGRPKLAARAFRFPFVVDGARAWGKAPVAGELVVQRRRRGRWVTVARANVAAGAVFTRRVPEVRGATYRAQVGGVTSLTWR